MKSTLGISRRSSRVTERTLSRRHALLMFGTAAMVACDRAGAAGEPWTADRVMATDDLAKRLPKGPATGPLILHVGPAVLFRKGHIPGSVHAGEGGDPEGLNAIADYAKPTPHDREIVVYCGCCPWDHCPNIRPTYSRLTSLGFTNVHVLDLPKTLQANWIDKGLPLET